MSIKTLSKKMLAIVAAGAMTMGLAMPTSVFAADVGTTTTEKEAYISKTFNTVVGKDETFSLFFVKHFSLKKASEFPVFNEGFSLL